MATDHSDANVPRPGGGDAPQKYIRTFAGDMEVVKEGGQPDLAPFDESDQGGTTRVKAIPAPSAKTEATLAPQPALEAETPSKILDKMAEIAVPEPPRTTTVPTPALPDEEKERQEILARLRATKVRAKRQLEVAVEKPLPPEVRASAEVASPIHTYSEDFSDRIKEEHASTATVLAAEQDAAPLSKPSVQKNTEPHKVLYIVVGALLVLASSVGMYYAYWQYQVKNAPVVITQTIPAPIVVDDQREVKGEGATLMEAVQQAAAEPLASGSVRLLYSASATTTRRSVFVTMAPPAPNILLRNIQGSGSMAGALSLHGAQSPFFILSVSSYNDTFSGLLLWESAMKTDLASLFPAYPAPLLATPTPATTTPPVKEVKKKKGTTTTSTTIPPAPAPAPVVVIAPGFHDETIANHDVRIYRDSSGRSILLYGYWNKNTLIIARDPDAFSEIIARLASVRTRP